MQGLISELGVPQDVIKVYCDSHSAICLTKNDMYQFKTKHINIKYHFIRDIVAEGKIKVDTIYLLFLYYFVHFMVIVKVDKVLCLYKYGHLYYEQHTI
jgi:hypothetical protein